MKRTYIIIYSNTTVCEIPNHNKKRSQTKFYWTINELKNNAPYFSNTCSNHSQSFLRTREWILKNHPELFL
jgi:hypothetical protein